jgi:hypothetical protein
MLFEKNQYLIALGRTSTTMLNIEHLCLALDFKEKIFSFSSSMMSAGGLCKYNLSG